MKITRSIAPAALLLLLAGACATTAVRDPLVDVPAGNYVLVEPRSDVYNAVAITDRAFTLRVGDDIMRGQHWVDADRRIHMAFDTGPCAGQESIWTYGYTGNRVTLNLVEDLCPVRRPTLPQRMVYERR